MQKLGLDNNFWFGHQGWEYVDIGRFWQIFLFVGLLLWLMLVGRALWPALQRRTTSTSIVGLLFLSTIAIGLFYGAGLMWGEHTHLSMVEYWRWWVVHLWVEGFFEVFATAVIALPVLAPRPGARAHRDRHRAVRDDRVHVRRRARHVASPVLHRHADGGDRARRQLLRARSGAAGVHRLRGLSTPASSASATPWMQRYRWPIMFFTRGGVLESGRRRTVRLPDQPAAARCTTCRA